MVWYQVPVHATKNWCLFDPLSSASGRIKAYFRSRLHLIIQNPWRILGAKSWGTHIELLRLLTEKQNLTLNILLWRPCIFQKKRLRLPHPVLQSRYPWARHLTHHASLPTIISLSSQELNWLLFVFSHIIILMHSFLVCKIYFHPSSQHDIHPRYQFWHLAS